MLSTAYDNIIKNAIKTVDFDDFTEWNIDKYDPIAGFNHTNTNEIFTFINTSQNGISYLWDFGDGNTATQENPTHTYSSTGDFTVTLTITNCNQTHHTTTTVTVNALSVQGHEENTGFIVLKNPVYNELEITATLFATTTHTIAIYSVLGQEIFKKQTSLQVNQKINTQSLQTGVYFIRITHEDKQVFTTKFLKL